MEDKLEYKITYGKEDFTDARLIRQHVFVEEQGFENEFDEIDEYAYHYNRLIDMFAASM